MQREEIDVVLAKLSAIEGREFTPAKAAAWFEILEPHTLTDALAAVVAFHSKPFKRVAYPGDIKALILETEGLRLRRCGTLEVNEAEWFNGPTGPVHAKLRRLVSTGEWTADDYRSYRRSGLTIDEHSAALGVRVG